MLLLLSVLVACNKTTDEKLHSEFLSKEDDKYSLVIVFKDTELKDYPLDTSIVNENHEKVDEMTIYYSNEHQNLSPLNIIQMPTYLIFDTQKLIYRSTDAEAFMNFFMTL